jgi:hypothetical protein
VCARLARAYFYSDFVDLFVLLGVEGMTDSSVLGVNKQVPGI